MLSGYLDDAAETPWNEYKKGLIDLIISAVAVFTFLNFNSTTISLGFTELEIPKLSMPYWALSSSGFPSM